MTRLTSAVFGPHLSAPLQPALIELSECCTDCTRIASTGCTPVAAVVMDHESMLSSSRASARRSTRGSKREHIPAQHENAAAKVDPWAAISESLLQARAQARAPSAQSVRSFRTQDSRAPRRRADDRPDPDATSEAGFSFASSFDESVYGQGDRGLARGDRGPLQPASVPDYSRRLSRSSSVLRRLTSFLVRSAKSEKYAWWTAVVAVVFIKWCIGFGGYSGEPVLLAHDPQSS